MATVIGYKGQYDIIVDQGGSLSDIWTLKSGGVAEDITGSTFLLNVVEKCTGALLFSVVPTIYSAVDGQISVDITPTETANSPDTYTYNIKETLAGGQVRFWVGGDFVIKVTV
jgi:hypothetical protein